MKRTLLAAAVILVLAFAAYSNSFRASFQLDDAHQIVDNHNVRSLSNVPLFFIDPSRASYYREIPGYRPVTLSTFALNYAVTKLNVSGFHAFNFVLHFLNALLVFILVNAVLKKAGRDDPFYLALFAAAVFAVHPIQTNAVTYISGRAVLLATFFYLLGFISFMRYRDSEQGPGPVKYFFAAAVPAFYLLGLLSKEMAVSLPASMLAYDLIFTVPGMGGPRRWSRALAPYVLGAISAGAYLAVKRSLEGHFVSGGFDYPVTTYLMSEAKVLLMYIRLLILPINQCGDYNLPATVKPDALVLLSCALAASCLYSLYRFRKAAPAISFFGFWFFIALAPESSLVPIRDIAQEYRLYLPSVGFIAAVSMLSWAALKRQAVRRAFAVCVTVLLILLAVNRNAVWANNYTYWGDVLKKAADPWRAHMGIANALYVDGRYEDAIGELTKSIEAGEANFQIFKAYNNIGLCYYMLGKYDKARDQFLKVAREYPSFTQVYESLGMASFELGQYKDAARAFEEQNRRMPGNPLAHYHLGISYLMLGRHADARVELEKAIEFGLTGFDVHYNLALAYEKDGARDGALKEARAALRIAKDDGEAGQAEDILVRLEGGGR